MCGITGIISLYSSKEALRQKVSKMQSTLFHRGPDDEGLFLEPHLPVALGHRRLAIIDPEHGKQPMSTEDGLFTIVFNGTIYNYIELRQQLIQYGHSIRSYSDTEVLLYAYKEWGENCLDHLLGMFAFAIWDKQKHLLFCARDRVGIKPFYYFFNQHQFIFASEIKAILAEGTVDPQPNEAGLKDYLTFQFCLAEKTLFKDIIKLQPGYYLIVDLNVKQEQLKLQHKQYWDVSYHPDNTYSESQYIDRLTALIENAISMHLRSDVPLGAHLSGGLDSSAIVAHAVKLSTKHRLKTFTGAFPNGPQFDETAYAKIVAEKTGAEYHEIYITENDFPNLLPKLIHLMDEPVAGPGLIPQYYVSKLAAEKQVKVILGGQGGDEIFIGYARYLVAYLEQALFESIYQKKNSMRNSISLESIIPHLSLLQTYRPMLQKFWRNGLFDPQDKRYFTLIDRSNETASLISNKTLNQDYSPFTSFQQIFNRKGLDSLINQMTYFDLKASLPALLHVEDRTSMAVSIESRVPLLDHRIIELMAHIPSDIKFAGGRTKHLFKESVRHIVPTKILQRKDKIGFNTPFNQWISGSAKEFVKETLLSQRARQRGLYNMEEMTSLSNDENIFDRAVWGALCLELWHRIYIDGDREYV